VRHKFKYRTEDRNAFKHYVLRMYWIIYKNNRLKFQVKLYWTDKNRKCVNVHRKWWRNTCIRYNFGANARPTKTLGFRRFPQSLQGNARILFSLHHSPTILTLAPHCLLYWQRRNINYKKTSYKRRRAGQVIKNLRLYVIPCSKHVEWLEYTHGER